MARYLERQPSAAPSLRERIFGAPSGANAENAVRDRTRARLAVIDEEAVTAQCKVQAVNHVVATVMTGHTANTMRGALQCRGDVVLADDLAVVARAAQLINMDILNELGNTLTREGRLR